MRDFTLRHRAMILGIQTGRTRRDPIGGILFRDIEMNTPETSPRGGSALPPRNKSRQMAGKVSIVSRSGVYRGRFVAHPPPPRSDARKGCEVPIARGRILRTKWFSSPPVLSRRAAGVARKGSHPPTFNTSARRNV